MAHGGRENVKREDPHPNPLAGSRIFPLASPGVAGEGEEPLTPALSPGVPGARG